MWTIKYQPRKMDDIIGQIVAKENFLKWIKNWKPGDKAALFYGPSGVGKTSMIYAYCEENNIDVIELNASDYRTAKQISDIIGSSSKQQSLLKKKKIFLIDEIDGIATQDKSGINEIIKIIKDSKYPIVFTANDLWNKKISKIKENCVEIRFENIKYWDILLVLKRICSLEGIKYEEDVLKFIAKTSQGDLRAAINDLQKICVGKKELKKEDINLVSLREKESEIFESLRIIFKSKSAVSSKSSIDNIDKDVRDVFWWIEQNILNEYEEIVEIAKSFEMLSLSDLYLFRSENRRNYKLMKYFIDFMTIGVSLSKKNQYKKFVKYEYPDIIKYFASKKTEKENEKNILMDLSKELHCSTKKIKTEFMPYFNFLYGNRKSGI